MLKRISPFFTEDKYVAIVIVLNAIVIFFLAFEELSEYHLTLSTIDVVFVVYFLIEAILKISESGFKKYISSNWNQFDFFIVLVSLPTILELLDHGLAFLFVFRILRVFRFFKFLKFVPNIDALLMGIKRAFKASVFVVMAFFIYMFLISMISCRLFSEMSPAYFSDPITSLYSIFQVFTIEGWYEIPNNLSDNITGENAWVYKSFIKLFFVVIVMSGGILGMSIVNAIFVDEMVSDNNNELLEKVNRLERKIDVLNQRLRKL